MNPSLLANAVNGVPESKNVFEFQTLCRISSYAIALDVLKFLNRAGIGKLSGNQVEFSQEDKLDLILLALEYDYDSTLLSSKLDWRDFEEFSTLILGQTGYVCNRNITITKPRIQIDVIARLNGTALIIDCKHWKKMSANKMNECANKQYKRTELYMKTDKRIRTGIPIIVTLYDHLCRSANGIPYVPISKFRSFLTEYTSYKDEIPHISREQFPLI